MHFVASAVGVFLLALTATIQPCPAPLGSFFELGADMAGQVADLAISSSGNKRDFLPEQAGGLQPVVRGTPAGVPKYNYDLCKKDLKGRHIKVLTHSTSSAKFTGLPATCMVLANVFVGDGNSGPRPTPCGNDCIIYTGLTKSEFKKLVSTLKATGKVKD